MLPLRVMGDWGPHAEILAKTEISHCQNYDQPLSVDVLENISVEVENVVTCKSRKQGGGPNIAISCSYSLVLCSIIATALQHCLIWT